MPCASHVASFDLRIPHPCRQWNLLSLAIITTIALAGCGVIRGAPEPVIDVTQERTDLSIYLSGDVLTKFYATNDAERNNMSQAAWRDAVIAARIEIADQNYQAFKSELYAATSGLNLATDLAALGLSGAAAVSGMGAAQALSAASTGVLGAGIAFNKDAFYQKTLPPIFAQMEADRTAVLVRIRTSQVSNDPTKYTLAAALADISAYERAGTLETAIQALTTSATNQADANKQQLQRIFSYSSLDSSGKTLEDLLTGANGNFDAAKVRIMRACFPAAGVPANTFNTDFVHGPEFAEQRVKVIACMQAQPPVAIVSPRPAAPAPLPVAVPAPDPAFGEIRQRIVDQSGRITPAGRNQVLACYPSAAVPPATRLVDFLQLPQFAEARQKVLDCMKQSPAGQ